MGRVVGLDDLGRVADLIDQTVVLLQYGCSPRERDVLAGLAQRLRIDRDEIVKARSRAPENMLLPENDPRVKAAVRAMAWVETDRHVREPNFSLDWRDCAEVVNAVLAADDELVGRPGQSDLTELIRLDEEDFRERGEALRAKSTNGSNASLRNSGRADGYLEAADRLKARLEGRSA